MGKAIFIASVVTFVIIVLSSFIVGVHSSSLLRQRRQADSDNTDQEVDPFGEVVNERGAPSGSGQTTTPPAIGAPAAAVGDNSTTPAAPTNSTAASGDVGEDEGTSAVTVTVVIIILVLIVILCVSVFLYLRIRKRRMADYEKKTQIQMFSTSNAGVYVDLTTAPQADKPQSPETEHLNKEDD